MRLRPTVIRLAVVATCYYSACASAQQAEPPPTSVEPARAEAQKLQSVEVTASRRVSRSQDVPYSVQAIDKATIQEKDLKNFEDYVGLVPGLSYGNSGAGRSDVFLRGISSPGVGRSAVGLYIDEIPLAFSGFQPDNNIYDMLRIEVLKGPQGTLYGEGSLGGAIKLVTTKPRSDRFEASTQFSLSQPAGGRLGGTVNAMINVPLQQDKVALRLVGTSDHEGGWIDNPQLGLADVNRSHFNSVRAQLSVDVTKDLNLLFTWMGGRRLMGGQTYADYGASDLSVQHRPVVDNAEERTDTYNLTADWTVGTGSITFSASQSKRELTELQWVKANSEDIGAALGIPDLNFYLSGQSRFNISSQELRYVSPDAGPFKYVAGIFHKKRSQPFVAVVPNSPLTAGILPDPIYDNVVHVEDEETAIFGEATYDVTSKLHLTAGARFSRETNKVMSDLFVFYAGQIPTQTGDAVHRSVSPRVSLGYDLSRVQAVYATVGKGYRSGGANFQIDPTQGDPLTFRPDTAINFEIGHKAAWFNESMFSEIALYHMKWDNIQLFTNSEDGTRSYTFNGGKASTTGLELDLRARPVAGLDITVGLGLLDAKYDSDIPEVGVTRGSRLPFSPRATGSLGVAYKQALGSGLTGSLQADLLHTGRRLGSARDELQSFTTFNVRAGLKRGNYELVLFGKNLTNSQTTLDTVRSVGASIPSRPRTVGISVAASY